jgi:TP901 family phage tail tape measure protein
MADDIRSDIIIGVDTSVGIAEIKNLQRQISQLNAQLLKSGAQQAAAAQNIQRNLINNINATGKFAAGVKNISSTAESFTTNLERNKLGMGEYFRYAAGATKTFGRLFTKEFDTIQKVAESRVKTLQTQYIKLGRDANGALKAISVRPLALDMDNLATKTAIAAQKQQLFNQLLQQGSTNLLNFGKNTQWAGRQLMVGFTVPLMYLGTVAGKTFMKMEEQAIKFRRVYGDTFTATEDTEKMIKQVQQLANEFTKYGVAAEKTMEMAAQAAAMGLQNADLLAQVNQATRLAVLGGVEQEKALETTISLMNAFGTEAKDLTKNIDFLNAVENQTVTAIEDLTIAIPKAAPVIKQLGGDVQDLAFFLTAMKEGGINASEGANALKSGLASLINPTGKASEFLQSFGINLKGIVDANKGNVRGLVLDFAKALDTLDPLNRARAIEQLFGKFQFARLSTLFQNVVKEGTQAQRVLSITRQTTEELAILSERELKRVEDSPMYKFKKAVEDIKVSLIPLGEAFLKAITPVIEFAKGLLDRFNSMSEGAKNFVVVLTTLFAGIGPVLLMSFGLIANGVANLIKMFGLISKVFRGAGSSSKDLGLSTDYMTQQQLEAAAVASSLDQTHAKLIQTFNVESSAVDKLAAAYSRATAAQSRLVGPAGAGAKGAAPRPKKYAKGVVSVPGPKGAGDVVPAMLSPGEAIIPAKQSEKYSGLIRGMINDEIPGYSIGRLGAAARAKAVNIGMPKSFKAISKNREVGQLPYENLLNSRYKDVPPTKYGHQIAPTSGHSFPIFGLGGAYTRADGTKVFVKPMLDERSAIAEIRATQIARKVHGLDAPDQRIVVIRDPEDITGRRRFLALESKLDKKFVFDGTRAKFTKEEYFKQHVAALLRADKDLSASNVFGKVVADVGPAGVFSRASGVRDFADKLPSMAEQATINLLGVKGGAKRAFAESTVGLMSTMTADQYHASMIAEIKRALPELRKTIAGFNLQDPAEKAAYANMVKRLEDGLNVDWRKFHEMHSAVKITPPKQTTVPQVQQYAEGTPSVPKPSRLKKVVGAKAAQVKKIGQKFFAGTVSVPGVEEKFLIEDAKTSQEITEIQKRINAFVDAEGETGRKIVRATLETFGSDPKFDAKSFTKYAVYAAEQVLGKNADTKKLKEFGLLLGETESQQLKMREAAAQGVTSNLAEELKAADPERLKALQSFNQSLFDAVLEDPDTEKEYQKFRSSTKTEDVKLLEQLKKQGLTEDNIKKLWKERKARNVVGYDPTDPMIKHGLERGHVPGLPVSVKRFGAEIWNPPFVETDSRKLNGFISSLTGNDNKTPTSVMKTLEKYKDNALADKNLTTSLFEKLKANGALGADDLRALGSVLNAIPEEETTRDMRIIRKSLSKVDPAKIAPKPLPANEVMKKFNEKILGGRKLMFKGKPLGFKKGVVSVPGPKGAGDVVPAMLSPGEAVIPTKMSEKYAPLINAMVTDSVPGYAKGKKSRANFGQNYGPIQRGEMPASPDLTTSGVKRAMDRTLANATSTMGEALSTSIKKNFSFRNMRGSFKAIQKDMTGSLRQLVKQAIGGASQAIGKTLRDPSAVKVLQAQALVRGGQFGPAIAGGIQAASSTLRFMDKHPQIAAQAKQVGAKLIEKIVPQKVQTKIANILTGEGARPVGVKPTKPVKIVTPEEKKAARDAKRQQRAADLEERRATRGTFRERYNDLSEKYSSRMGRFTGAAGGAAGAAMMGAMMVGMGEGPMAKMANDIMPALLVASIALPLLGSIPGAIAVAVASVVGALFLLQSRFDDAQKKVLEYSESMKASNKAVEAIAEFGGTVTATQIMDRRRAERDRELGAVAGKTTYGEAFVQTEAGKKQVETLAKQIASGNRAGSVADMTSQLSSSVLSGAMTMNQARSMAASLANEAGDASIAIDVIGKMEKILGPDGGDISKNPLKVRMDMLAENQKTMASSLDAAQGMNGFNKLQGTTGGRTTSVVGMGLAGAGIGAAIGSLGGPIGAVIGAAIGGIAGAVGGYFATEAATAEYAKLGAAAAVDAKIALEQNKLLLDSMDLFYEKKIEELRLQGKINEANAMQVRYMDERKTLTQSMADMNQAILDGFNEDPLLQESLTSGAKKAVEAKYKDNADQLAYVDVVGAQASQLGLGGDIQYLINLKMASGEIPPATMRKLLAIAAGSEEAEDAVVSIMTKFSGDVAGRTAELGNMLGGGELAQTLTLKVNAQATDGEATDLLNNVSELTRLNAVIPAKVAAEFYFKNPAAYNKFNKLIDTINDKKPKTIKAVLEIAPELKGKISKEDELYFNTLSDEQKVVWTKTLVSQLYVPEPDIIASEDFKTWQSVEEDIDGYTYGGKQFANLDLATQVAHYRAQEAFKATQAAAVAPTTTGNGDGIGGGGGGRNEPLDDPLQRLREIRDSRINAKGGSKEMMRLLGGNKNITRFKGLEQQLMGLGADSEFANYLMGLDEAEQKKYFKVNKKTGALNFTDLGKATKKGFADIALGEFNVQMKQATVDVKNQNIALQRLVASGMSVSDAYAAVEDTALAAALASKDLSKVELQELTAEANRAAKAMAALEAAKTLRSDIAEENRNIGFENLFATDLSADTVIRKDLVFDKNGKPVMGKDGKQATKDIKLGMNLGYLEQQAISSDSNLSEIFKQFMEGKIDKLPEDFSARIAQVMSSVEFKETIFNDGYNKAMEQFAAREKEIQIDADIKLRDFKLVGFDEVFGKGAKQIAAIAQDEIAGLQYQIDDWQAGLQEIAWQEDDINKAYDKKFEALEKIEQVNQRITAQQQKQLGIADALTRGDIAAAARAAQEFRDQSARDAIAAQRDSMNKAKQNELDALTAKTGVAAGMTKAQLDEKILANQKKIFKIEEERLEPAQEFIRDTQATADIQLQGIQDQKLTWEETANNIELAKVNTAQYTRAINAGLAMATDLAASYGKSRQQTTLDMQSAANQANVMSGVNGSTKQSNAPATTTQSQDGNPDVEPEKPTTDAGYGMQWVKKDGEWIAQSVQKPGLYQQGKVWIWNNDKDKWDLQDYAGNMSPAINPGDGKKWSYNAKTNTWDKVDKGELGSMGNPYSIPGVMPGMSLPKDKNRKLSVPMGKYVQMPKGFYVSGVSDNGNSVDIWWGDEPNIKNKKTSGKIVKIERDFAGKVPNWDRFNVGGRVIGSDTVPAMLTPGEFVVRKYAVQNFGADKLKAINNGTYSGDSMYNYEVNVNVQTDADADQIARAVIGQIKQIDSQRIRGNRF